MKNKALWSPPNLSVTPAVNASRSGCIFLHLSTTFPRGVITFSLPSCWCPESSFLPHRRHLSVLHSAWLLSKLITFPTSPSSPAQDTFPGDHSTVFDVQKQTLLTQDIFLWPGRSCCYCCHHCFIPFSFEFVCNISSIISNYSLITWEIHCSWDLFILHIY